MNLVNTTTTMNLPSLEWQSYEVTVGTSPTRLFPEQLSITGATVSAGSSEVVFEVASGGANKTKWLRPGMAVRIAGFTSTGVILNQSWVIKTVTIASGTFSAIPTKQAQNNIRDSIGFGIGGASANCNLYAAHAQKAYIAVPSGGATVTIGPSLNAITNNFGWRKDIAASAERELFAPHGGKFDLGEWYAKVASSTQVVQILFI